MLWGMLRPWIGLLPWNGHGDQTGVFPEASAGVKEEIPGKYNVRGVGVGVAGNRVQARLTQNFPVQVCQ